MGIRVSCPNGHVLNVKSHLAGKKGRCPTCDAVFEVPNGAAEQELDPDAPRTAFDQIDIEQLTKESREAGSKEAARKPAGEVRPRTSAGRAPSPGEESVSVAVVDAPQKENRQESGPPNDITTDPNAVWYVRRASGEQYGPAQGMMFWQWIQEGRVPEDSHVWKQGWPEWKSAREWLAKKETTPQRAQPLSLPPVRGERSGPVTNAAAAVSPLPQALTAIPSGVPSAVSSPVAVAATRNVRRRKGSDIPAAVIIILLLLFLASLTGAIVVVYQSMQ
jgi:GYF domain 2